MSKRKIIHIDADKCTGCGLCIPNCPEGALQIIDEKARLVSDLFCDGLGACLGHCPEGAITIEEREAEAYDEKKVMENITKQGENVIRAHLKHLQEHGQEKYFQEAQDFLKEKNIQVSLEEKISSPPAGGCPGVQARALKGKGAASSETKSGTLFSELRQWPIQITLVPPQAPYLAGADLLIAADCVPFAYANFHEDFLKGKVVLIGCPKLDDLAFYKEKLTKIFKENDLKSITCVHMEVPCCFGLIKVTQEALSLAGKNIPFKEITVGIEGELKK